MDKHVDYLYHHANTVLALDLMNIGTTDHRRYVNQKSTLFPPPTESY